MARTKQLASVAGCGRRGLCGWSPPSLPADTALKRRIDRALVSKAAACALYGGVVVLLIIAPHLPLPASLAVDGLVGLAGGAWCSLNFWRCRHAHCVVTGAGWLAIGLFTFVEAGLGHSVIGGYEQPAFLGVLALGLAFEGVWWLARQTNALPLGVPSTRH